MNYIFSKIQEHPVTSGYVSSGATGGFSLIGILSSEQTVRFIGSIGGILGIVLTCLSIFYMIKKNMRRI